MRFAIFMLNISNKSKRVKTICLKIVSTDFYVHGLDKSFERIFAGCFKSSAMNFVLTIHACMIKINYFYEFIANLIMNIVKFT